MNPSEFFTICLEKRWRLTIGLVSGAALGLMIGLVSKPSFKAEVLLVPIKQEMSGLQGLAGQLGGLASIAGIRIGGAGSNDNVPLAMLSSRILTERLIEEKQILPVLFAKKWDVATMQWRSDLSGGRPTLWQGERYFSKKVRRVSEDRRTGLISVEIYWSDPKVAAEWANQLVARADSMLRERAIDTAKGNISFLERQLNTTAVVEIRQSIYKLMEDQLKEMMLAQGGGEYAYKVLDPATAPERRIGPSVLALLVSGGAIGLLLGLLCFVLGRDLLRSRSP